MSRRTLCLVRSHLQESVYMPSDKPPSIAFAVRALQPKDKAAWLKLWDGYLAFYKAEVASDITQVTWLRFHDGDEPMYALGAFDGDALLGIVHAVKHRATWSEGWYLYLEDLFTVPSARGRGVGKALVEAIYAMADELGAARVYWHTHESNGVARRLYDHVGHNAGFLQYRRPV